MTDEKTSDFSGPKTADRAGLTPPGTVEFAPDRPMDLNQIADRTRGALTHDPATRSRRLVRLLDTPDQRLDRAGLRLEVKSPLNGTRSKTGALHLELRDRSGQDRASLDLPAKGPLPRFADDLPDGPLLELLHPIVEMRALLTWATLHLEEARTALRDRDGKIRVRLYQVSGETEINGVRSPIPVRIRVEPLKGYGTNAGAIAERIAREFGWVVCHEDLMVGLRRIGMAAEAVPLIGITTKPRLASDGPLEALDTTDTEPKVKSETPAGPAMRTLLGQLLETIESRRAGVIADVDSEFLHEFRVAVRRSRAAIQQLGDTLPEAALDRMREGYRWLGAATGPTRDLDVHMLALKAHSRSLSPKQASALVPLGSHLADCKTRAHKALIRDLKSERYETFISRCRTFLEAEAPGWSETEIKRRPISTVVGKRVVKIYRKTVRQGARIGPETEAEALHDLRKQLKKLRYLIEFIKNLLPKTDTRPLLQKLKTLQQVLGDVQDLEIQTEALHRFGREMAEASKADPDTLMAIGAWAEDLDRKRAEARARFAEVFAPFAERATAQAFRATFAPKSRSHAPQDGETAG